MIAALLAASLTFTATATGVGKGTPLEFVFVGKDSDRDYEAMFIVDEPLPVLCQRMEQAGLPRGRPTDQASCRLWPVGCALTFDPPHWEVKVRANFARFLPSLFKGISVIPDVEKEKLPVGFKKIFPADGNGNKFDRVTIKFTEC